jgi:hypothetical protein
MKLVMDKETLITLEEYRAAHNLPKIENYGMSVEHNPKSKEIYDFISEVDFGMEEYLC